MHCLQLLCLHHLTVMCHNHALVAHACSVHYQIRLNVQKHFCNLTVFFLISLPQVLDKYFCIFPAVVSQFSLLEAMNIQVLPLRSPWPSPAMSPSAPSSSPISSTPPAATTACARGTCTPVQGRALRSRSNRYLLPSPEPGLKPGLGQEREKR